MRVRFLTNLGTMDAKECELKCNCTLDASKCCEGAVVDIPDKAAEFLRKKYAGLFEPAQTIKGVPADK